MNDQIHLTKKERRELRRQEKIENQKKLQRNKSTKKTFMWISIFAGLGLIVYGLFLLGGGSSSSASSVLADRVAPSDHVTGNTDSSIILVEYSDFQCPACAAYHTIVKQLLEDMGDSVQFVYRNFPLTSIHQNAQIAAQAAEAAAQQGKFWEMYDLLFENQTQWSEVNQPETVFENYADSLGLDIDQFKQDLESDIIKDKVETDYQSGVRSQVNATPTFFLNGKQIQNPNNYESFRDLVQQAAS